MSPNQNNTGDETDIEESIRTLVDGLPVPVRNFVTSDEPDAVVLLLSKKYQLHADQAGHLHQALLFMLLGVYSPEQFVDKLIGAGFPEEAVGGVVADINERIFTPLRNAENTDVPVPTPQTRTPLVQVPTFLPTPSLVQKLTAHTALLAVSPTPLASILQSAPTTIPETPPWTPTPIQEPTMRTMAHDVESMKEGAIPAPVPYTMPKTPQEVAPRAQPLVAPQLQAIPPQEPVRAAIPVTTSPVRTWIQTPVPSAQIPVAPQISRVPSPDPAELTATLQKYGIDPYRELPE